MLLWLATFFLVLGSVVTFIAALGVLRLPDFFMRMHAATKAGVAGPGLILIGVGCSDPSWATWAKILIAILFLVVTTPVAGHLLGKAGFVGGVTLWAGTTKNELKSVLPPGQFLRTDSADRSPLGPSDIVNHEDVKS